MEGHLMLNFLFNGVIAGIIAGLVVFAILEYRERKRWKLIKEKLVTRLNIAMNGIITTIRLNADIKLPERINITNDLLSFINDEILNKFKEHELKFQYLDLNRRKNLLSGFAETLTYLNQLSVLFIDFRSVGSRYLEIIFELQDKINSAFLPYHICPEIAMPEYNNDCMLNADRILASKNIYELCKFIADMKNTSLIKDFVKYKR